MTPASYLTGSLLLLLLHHIAVMKGAVLVAIAASIGNFLQGWDNATIAGMIPIPTSFYASCSFCFYLIMGRRPSQSATGPEHVVITVAPIRDMATTSPSIVVSKARSFLM